MATPTAPAVSDAVALELLARAGKFHPENVSGYGLTEFDTEVRDLGPELDARLLAAVKDDHARLERRILTEPDPALRVDLEIMCDAYARRAERLEAERRLLLPYRNAMATIYDGVRSLLDDEVSPERRVHAKTRLARYAGLEAGWRPLTELALERWRERAHDEAALGPGRAEVEKDLGNAPTLVNGLAPLFQKYGVTGYEAALAALRPQVDAYVAATRAEVLPRARTEHRLPHEIYALELRDYGVEIPVAELASRARVAFREIQNEMQALAPLVAKEQGIPSGDYRAVLAELKQKQFKGEAILPHYRKRMQDLEAIIERERIVTLPAREALIRLADEAESAAHPAPHMDPPRLVGNTGERGTFVLPLRVPAVAGQGNLEYDDFTFEAASWTLTAHEGRPGHELQFASCVERGVSLARQLFAFNSTNVEGWALYMEAETKPFEPLDGQLVALQHRLLRAARAFLDPGLQDGSVTPEEADRVLQKDVVVSPAMALQEVERYTFRAPGQATSYFCGYLQLMELRTEIERRLGERFDKRRYHDFLLAQGFLPGRLLRGAVLTEFLPAATAREA
jgi:hypothetical protein